MEQEYQELLIEFDDLQKENIMLNASLDGKYNEILELEKEFKSFRTTINKTVDTLQMENDELRTELIDNTMLIDQAQKTLRRSKSLCDLSHSTENVRLQQSPTLSDTNEQLIQAVNALEETLYDSKRKSKSLQSLRPKYRRRNNSHTELPTRPRSKLFLRSRGYNQEICEIV